MRELARNKETGYLFPAWDYLVNSIDYTVVEVPDDFSGERLDDYGNMIGHDDNPRDDTSDGEVLEETLAPVKKVTKKKVAKKKAAAKKGLPAHDDLFDGID